MLLSDTHSKKIKFNKVLLKIIDKMAEIMYITIANFSKWKMMLKLLCLFNVLNIMFYLRYYFLWQIFSY